MNAIIAFAALFAFANAQSPVYHRTAVKKGVNGYSAFRQVEITTQYLASYNCFNGATYADPGFSYNQWLVLGSQYSIGWSSSSNEIYRALIRYESLSSQIPTNAVVAAATLTYSVVQWTSKACKVNYNYLNKAWSYNTNEKIGSCSGGADGYRVGWAYADPTNPWTQPGALADTVPDLSFSTTTNGNGAQNVNITLDAAQVQEWVTAGTTNNGLLVHLANNSQYDGCHVAFLNFPTLSVVFTCPAGFVPSNTPDNQPATCDAVPCPSTGYQGSSPSCSCAAGFSGCGWDGGSNWIPATPVACPSVGYTGATPACACADGYDECGWDFGSQSWIPATPLTCAVTDANAVGAPVTALLGTSLSVSCNSGFIGGGSATCVAGTGPTVQLSNGIVPCTPEACWVTIPRSVGGSYTALIGASVTVECQSPFVGGGAITCTSAGVFDSTPACV